MLVELIVGISLVGSFVMIIVVIWGEFKRKEAKLQHQAELARRLVERFGSAEELNAFFQTEAGRRLLDVSPKGPSNPKHRIIGSVEGGIIVGLMGLGFLYVAVKHEREAIWAAMFFLGLGAGLLVSAYAGYRLSKRWGVFNGAEKR
jgi:hypothetical protein